ncbi:hypothetical protein EST38_g6730 [Candolleomyces aberdarensis]|uniref:Histone deacetylase interacting domain-containing protein n=1 Tax=Candolleomyces aberdarensis TaxID=2316362 RepID=A0A4Q2DH24_9AGAR|nr:hypothetical protein EST38_g6730 [Candolleomyces aberdarensis]
MSVDQMNRPLNVTDALGYLDAVKNQFQEKPDVYNQFLDIMKDFKSQAIDTPGVIQRVSQLFHGNPTLIQGFNTFLPHGYRIDISPDHDHTITVTTPTGTTTQSTGTNVILSRTTREMPALAGPGLVYPGVLAGPARALTPHGYLHSHDPAPYSPGFQQQTTAASFLGGLNKNNGAGGPTVESGPPTEFNHAIQYLNKIKARYADDQNTYKQFLDILQTYQREGKNSQDNQVYVQVQMLFKEAPELIDEFKNFLPEAVGGGVLQQNAQMMANQMWAQQHQQAPPSPQPAKKLAPAKRKKRTEKEPTPVPLPKAALSRQTKKVKHHHLPDTGSPSFSPHIPPRSPPPQSHMYPPAVQQPPVHTAPVDKLMFFDRAKRALESKEMYEEFLKLLSLFSKEIIDSQTLIERAKVFLGEETLLTEFKDVVGWDERMENPLDYGPPGSIRTQAPDACAPQPVDDGEGPSYRRLPESEIRLACSGRDELCRSVLNDDWVSHPTWASEEAGFVAHKKNSFEEALHKSEEERHEYHVHLEALTRTIAILEPLNARIEEMTPEERATFRLKPDFGGSSKSLYHRTIKRIYGRDNSAEIILAMQEGPSVAVPVVLARLKHKDEDWRRAMREYSRTWREVDSKNFYKSLDHQGISFKTNDKKNITSKCFVQDIEAIQEQQVKDWEDENGGRPSASAKSFAKRSIGHQLEYAFADTSVLLDSLKLVYSFLDRSQVQYSPQERRTVEKFLRAFIPRLCHFPEAEFNAACGHLEGAPSAHGGGAAATEEEAHEGTGDGSRSGRRSNGSSTSQANGHSNGVPASDLRKKLLKTAQEKASRKDAAATATTTGGATTAGSNTRGSNSGIGSRAATPSPVTENASRFAQLDEDGRVIPDVWIKEAPVASGSAEAGGGNDGSETADPVKPFFANTTFYTLLRLLQLLYSRLLMCKEIGADLAAKKHAPLLANETALELGLVDPSGPSVVLQQSMEALGERPGSEPTPNVVYLYLLNACEKMFDNEMDLATFEEHMRWFFGTTAYHLFTLDKLIAALIKQVQIVLSDHKCQELWTLLQLVQGSEHVTKQDIVRYRRSAEKHVAENDHFYRIQWDREKKSIRVSLTSQDDETIETDGSARRRWREYVNTYVMTYPTEWDPPAKSRVSPVFLRRCAQGNEEGSTASTILRDDHTRIRISLPTYKLVYEGGCEDVLGCSTSAVSAIDEQASRHPNGTTSTNNTSTSNTTASMDTDYDKIPDKLPPGWQPKEEMWGHESRTTLILAMSLVLAFLICFLIIGCLFWRKSMRRKHKGEQEQDVEQEGARRRKGRRRSRELDEDESREAILEKERANQKLWARATARWRANVRLKRRGKRSSQMSHARRSSISLDSPRDGLTSGRSSPSPSGSSPPSRSVSRRASSSSLRQESSAESSSAQQQQDTSTIPTISLSPPPPHSSPPAYQQKALQADLSSEGLFPNDDPASTSHLICSRRPSHSSFLSNSEGGSGAIPSIPSAHVATDDKAVLARLADLASAPEEDEGSSPQPQVSAPEWRDDEMEDFIAREACGGESDDFANQSTSTPSPFPPPPSKSSLLSPKFYDYPYAFEDMEIENLEPELGPSAPPFEETPSAPLVDEHGLGLVPSAPPMLDDDDFYVNDSPVPSAPPHEPSPSHSLTEDSDGNVSSAGQVVTGDGTASTGSGNGRPVLPDYHP